MPLPDKIFLQLGGEQFDPPNPDDFDELRIAGVITWHDRRVFDSDVEYIRADVHISAIEEAISHEREKRGFVVAENQKLTHALVLIKGRLEDYTDALKVFSATLESFGVELPSLDELMLNHEEEDE